MLDSRPCPRCGAPLPANAPSGLCPACLLLQGGADDTFTGAEPSPAFVPPAVSELAAKFPQLEITGLIGRGGMGAVYRARQRELERIVALKILPPGIGDSPAFAERFAREAKALAKLNHPNIVTLYEFGRTDGLYFFLMEFVDGVNLRQLLHAGRIEPREALAIVPQICDALQFAHDHGIIHRDIKPENLLLDRRGRVKVADFGLAKIVAAGTETASGNGQASPDAEWTEAGKVMGTPSYMAPEQTERPRDVDHRVDIYALGVVFYQMLTGELPTRHLEPPSRKVRIDVRLDEVVLRALENDPGRRYAQASVFKERVETLSAETAQPGAAPAARGGWTLRRLWPSGAVARTLVVLAALLAVLPTLHVAAVLGILGWETAREHAPVPPASPRPAGAAVAEHLRCGPVREITLVSNDATGGYDLDTGEFKTVRPSDGDGPGTANRWRRESGVDLFADLNTYTPGILFAGVTVVLADEALWTAPAAVVMRDGRMPSAVPAGTYNYSMQTLPAPSSRGRPYTHLFRTQQGGCGVLQILGANDRRDVKVRYKLVLSGPEESPSGQGAAANPAVGAAPTEDPDQLAQEGWRLWQSRQLTAAIAKFQAALKLAPDHANTWNGLGWASLNAGHVREAEQAFQKTVALEPNHPAALNGLGQIYLSQRKYDQAETALLKAAPQAPAAWYGLTRLYLLQGKFAEAEKYAQRVVDTGQADAVATKMLDAARERRLSDGLRAIIEPPPAPPTAPPAAEPKPSPGMVSALADPPPLLRALGWQDQVKVHPDEAWLPSGERLVSKANFPAFTGLDDSATEAARENPRFLCLWFSHPLFDAQSVALVTLLDGDGQNPLKTPDSSLAIGHTPPAPQYDNAGWITATLCAGTRGKTPSTATARLSYSVGPWKKRAEIAADFRGGKTLDTGVLLAAQGQDAAGQAFVQIVRDKTAGAGDAQLDFVAVQKNGQRLERTGWSGSGTGQMYTERFSFDVPLADVQVFECRERPIRVFTSKIVLPP